MNTRTYLHHCLPMIILALFLTTFVKTAEAAACTNNYWQPTFVHDLDNPDGPWYVTPSKNFAKLSIVNNRDWTPHACELINQSGVRNRRGYTNCQQYTRVQCGCKRGVSEGNSTCASFLVQHTKRYPTMAYQEGNQSSNSIGVGSKEVTGATNTGHSVQVWQIKPEYIRSGRYEVSIKHAAPGKQGSFYITAWADTNNDGKPDKEITRSPLMTSNFVGKWSSWKFSTNFKRVFVGNTWNQANERIYYQMGGSLSGYTGLSSKLYFSRKFNGAPTQSTGPRFTNIRVRAF